MCERSAELQASSSEQDRSERQREGGKVPGWLSSPPWTPAVLFNAHLIWTPLTGRAFLFSLSFRGRSSCWRTNDSSGSSPGFISLKAREATAVSPWRLLNSQGFSLIWRGTKSDLCLRWVRQLSSFCFFFFYGLSCFLEGDRCFAAKHLTCPAVALSGCHFIRAAVESVAGQLGSTNLCLHPHLHHSAFQKPEAFLETYSKEGRPGWRCW